MSVTALVVWGLYLYSTVGFPILFIILFTGRSFSLKVQTVFVGLLQMPLI